MPSITRLEGLDVQSAINVIMQKHFSDLTPEDISFLKARESYLTEVQRAIYLEGADPVVALQDAGRALTANERIIAENMPLQAEQHRIAVSRAAALAAEAATTADLTPEQRSDADKKLEEERTAHMDAITAEADRIAKDAADTSLVPSDAPVVAAPVAPVATTPAPTPAKKSTAKKSK